MGKNRAGHRALGPNFFVFLPHGQAAHAGALKRFAKTQTFHFPSIAMFDIQLNESGTRHLQITAENLSTIKKYSLFDGLVGSTGIVDETVLDKLKMTIRALIAHSSEDSKDLLDLCIDVIYHDKMKAYGLRNLIALYNKQKDSLAPADAAEAAEA